jgi:DNA modification methylase
MNDYKIICGDSLTEMKNMPNNTINCIIILHYKMAKS